METKNKTTENSNDEYVCLCKNNYKYRSSFTRHIKKCKKYNQSSDKFFTIVRTLNDRVQCIGKDSYIKELEEEIECIREENKALAENNIEYSTELRFRTEQIDDLKSQIYELKSEIKKYTNAFITHLVNSDNKKSDKNANSEANNNNGTNYSNNYINNNYYNAPVTTINNAEVLKKIMERDGYLNIFASWKNNKKVAEKIANMIIGTYKTDDLSQRSLWATDVSRLNYFVRELVNKKPEWKTDKGGIKVSKYVITPVLDLLKTTLLAWRDDFHKMSEEDQTNDDLLEPLNDIIGDIENGNLKKEILKLISPHFAFEKCDDD